MVVKVPKNWCTRDPTLDTDAQELWLLATLGSYTINIRHKANMDREFADTQGLTTTTTLVFAVTDSTHRLLPTIRVFLLVNHICKQNQSLDQFILTLPTSIACFRSLPRWRECWWCKHSLLDTVHQNSLRET